MHIHFTYFISSRSISFSLSVSKLFLLIHHVVPKVGAPVALRQLSAPDTVKGNIHKSTKGPLLSVGDTARHILEISILQWHHNRPLCLSFLEIICILSWNQAAWGVGVTAFVLYRPLMATDALHKNSTLFLGKCHFSLWMKFDEVWFYAPIPT